MLAQQLKAKTGEKRRLDSSFVPGKFDVICGKGKACFNHEGNQYFRKIVEGYLIMYSESITKLQKSNIVTTIVEMVREKSPNGGFVKMDTSTGLWYEVGDHQAREKVGQTIRDGLHLSYRSSTKSKKKIRQIEQAKATTNMRNISTCNYQISSKIVELHSQASSNMSDQELVKIFTEANIEILNELNKLNNRGISHPLPRP